MNKTENNTATSGIENIKLHPEANTHPFAPDAKALDELEAYFNATGKLPTQFVTCTRSGRRITMFGDNLRNRVAKYGGIRQLLSKFICKEAMAADKAKGIVHTDQPPSHSGFHSRGKKPMSEIEIREQIRQLEAMLSASQKTKADVKAEVKVEEPKATASAKK